MDGGMLLGMAGMEGLKALCCFVYRFPPLTLVQKGIICISQSVLASWEKKSTLALVLAERQHHFK